MVIINMCPICILTTIVYGICSILGLFGLRRLTNYIKLKYHIWSNTKCEVCKKLERDGTE